MRWGWHGPKPIIMERHGARTILTHIICTTCQYVWATSVYIQTEVSLFLSLFEFLTNLHISTNQSNAKPLLVLLSFRSFQVVNVVKINVNFLGRHLRNLGYLPGVFKQKVFLRSRFEVFLVEKIKVFLVERIVVQCREELGTRIFCRPRRPSRRKSAALPAFWFPPCFEFDFLASWFSSMF